MGNAYRDFLAAKRIRRCSYGFEPTWFPDKAFGFQRHLIEWDVRLGRAATFAAPGLGKTPIQLTVAENVVRHTNGNVLVLAPLAVAPQTVREGEKFGVVVRRTKGGTLCRGISVTNYQQLSHYDPDNYALVIADESSAIKQFEGKTRKLVTDFLSKVKYRLLCTATPAPNDFMELGTSSEALGDMTRSQMLAMFFANDGESTQQWRLKGHAKGRFWEWVSSWAKAVRMPSDLGFPDDGFVLPPLEVRQEVVPSERGSGFLPRLARTLAEQRRERRSSLTARCQRAAECVPAKRPCILWCQLNDEADLLEDLVPGAVQVAGSEADEAKEEKLTAFGLGQIRVLVTKPSIACFGLNYQHCADLVYFPTHSHEAYYQAVRRCYRFGQARKVTCHLVHSEAEQLVVSNMLRKERQAEEMYAGICRAVNRPEQRTAESNGLIETEVPAWLAKK